MKRIAVLFVLLVLVVFVGNAAAAQMFAGFKGGVNMADLGGDDAPENSSMRNGFSGGAFFGYDFTEQFSLRSEALYVMKGAEGEFVIPGDDHVHESIIKLNYIDIPVLLVAKFPVGDKLALNVCVGPSFNFNLDAEVEVPSHNETEDIKDFMKSFEFGAVAGGGVEYALSSLSILLDVRYSLGVSTIVDDVAGASVDVKNSGIGIMAGVAFPFGSK